MGNMPPLRHIEQSTDSSSEKSQKHQIPSPRKQYSTMNFNKSFKTIKKDKYGTYAEV